MPSSKWIARTVASVIGLVCFASAAAQQPPVFRSGIDLVTVDVSVLDDDGRPVQGLGSEDFTLKIDGRVRRIVSAQYVSQRAPTLGSVEAPAHHYSSNELASAGRLFVVAVDQGNIRRVEGTAAVRAAAAFIGALDPADRVAVTGLRHVGRLGITTDHAGARRELERLVGEADPVRVEFNIGLAEALTIGDGNRAKLNDVVRRECGQPVGRPENPRRFDEEGALRDPCPTQIEQEARAIAQFARTQTSLSISALLQLIERLGEIEGPKTLILLSEGLVAEPRLFDFGELGAAAQAARVTVYVMQLEVPVFEAAQERFSPSALQDDQLRADGLTRLAGAARGGLFHLVGSDPRPFRRITLELSGYYLLAFEPRESDRDGRLHRIQVSLGRRRALLRARSAFRLEEREPGLAKTTPEQLIDLLRARGLATELPLRAATYTCREPGTPKLRVVVSAEADTATGPASEAALGFVLVDERNVIVASAVHQSDSGYYAFSAVVPPGGYTLKVAAIDRLGRRGSVERPFVPRLARAGGLQVSDLILAEVSDGSQSSLRPVVDRAPHDRVLAYLELYGDRSLPLEEVNVRLVVTDGEADRPLVAAPATLSRGGGSWAIARALLPIQDLPAGRYMARADVFVAGRPITQVTRLFSVDR